MVAVILFATGAVWLALQIRLGKPLSALGFDADWNFGQHEYVSIVNTGSGTASNVFIRVRADYTCDEAGYAETTTRYPAINPGIEIRIPYQYSKGDLAEIGAMDVWITCDRGKAHDRWYCSYGMTWGDFQRQLFDEIHRHIDR